VDRVAGLRGFMKPVPSQLGHAAFFPVKSAHVLGGTRKTRNSLAESLEKIWPNVTFVEVRQPKARRVAKARRGKRK